MPTITIDKDLEELFTDLHHAQLFADGKTISDAVLKAAPAEVLSLYREEKNKEGFNLMSFYQAHFSKAPERENNYQSDTSQPVEKHIEKLWDVLTRLPEESENYSTLIPLPHKYVVPGGRFNEIYYWDSYFTMLGLQVSGRVDMIESMVDNFTHLINTIGFIPNGNRSYFLGRSQPPFYALMVHLLAEEKGDDVLEKYLPALEKEYAFWMTGAESLESGQAHRRAVKYDEGKILNRYFDNIPDPRAEMYFDDIELLERHGEGGEKLLLDIRAACESGWDFSSRWCRVPDDLATLHTTDILPVDLNCLIYFLEKLLAKANEISGDNERHLYFSKKASERKENINKLFWNEEEGFFYDYDFIKKEQKESLTLAGIFPLFFELVAEEKAKRCAQKIEECFLSDGGVLTTTFESGQQWDAPNGWAPLQWVTIKGLRNYNADELADEIKNRWTELNKKVFRNTGKLMEKYNVENINLESGGGEYPVQDGFGWTNGVLLKLLSE